MIYALTLSLFNRISRMRQSRTVRVIFCGNAVSSDGSSAIFFNMFGAKNMDMDATPGPDVLSIIYLPGF